MTILKEKIIRHETDGHTVKGMDAGELIRCKDCKHWYPSDYCTERDGLWYENDYCSQAERKENNE